jgi:hypothetical protein
MNSITGKRKGSFNNRCTDAISKKKGGRMKSGKKQRRKRLSWKTENAKSIPKKL